VKGAAGSRARRGPVSGVQLVAAGLALTDGGLGVVGRLLVGALGDVCQARGVPLGVFHFGSEEQVPPAAVPIRHFGRRSWRLWGAVTALELRRAARLLVFDHLGPASIQATIPPPLRAPYLVYVHGIEAWGTLSPRRQKALEGAAAAMVNSAYTAHRARLDQLGVAWTVVPPALESRPPSGAVADELLSRAGCGFVVIVGRMSGAERYKGHDLLLEAMPQLRRRIPAARLVVVGEGDDRPRLQRKAAELGVDGAVLFTGWVSEATRAALLRQAAVLALPSRSEGFGLVYLEAMEAGLPCVGLAGTAAAEIIVDGETGFLVDGTPEALAVALERLLGNGATARRMGASGRERLLQRFGVERFRAGVEEAVTAVWGGS